LDIPPPRQHNVAVEKAPTHGVGWTTFAYFTVFTTLMAVTATRLPRGTVVRK